MTRLAYLLGDPPIKELGRLRSDRVRQLPAPARQPGILGRPRKHGGELALSGPRPGHGLACDQSHRILGFAPGWSWRDWRGELNKLNSGHDIFCFF